MTVAYSTQQRELPIPPQHLINWRGHLRRLGISLLCRKWSQARSVRSDRDHERLNIPTNTWELLRSHVWQRSMPQPAHRHLLRPLKRCYKNAEY